MSALPFPAAIRAMLTDASGANRSLLFDRSFKFYDRSWRIISEDRRQGILDGKLEFFKDFIRRFAKSASPDFNAFLRRRQAALAELRAVPIRVRSTSRLVVGLGLPHPTETSLLLDRLTGCPYLPGSSVKGMLREAAKFVVKGEFAVADADKNFWSEAVVRRLFGPAVREPGYPAAGEMVSYDAFPSAWPTLELDVLTPHYSNYYTTGAIPGDWENPTPVRFLTVQAGTTFQFHFRGLCPNESQRARDEEAVTALLPLALDWIGIGGKTSSGYGLFGPADESGAVRAQAESVPTTATAGAVSRQGPQGSARNGARRPQRDLTRQAGRRPELYTRAPEPRKPDGSERPSNLPRPPKLLEADKAGRESATLDSPITDGRAWVLLEDGSRVKCKDLPSYPAHEPGDRMKVSVRREGGDLVEVRFKGWLRSSVA
ncbi:MAG: type III-B CRISPR module RAMP protein Cmr6 [Planctomycetes bacterium]|nr:type III-B CRISPR module RAMP protein Cmr6 [Planctomycetota bacterium]